MDIIFGAVCSNYLQSLPFAYNTASSHSTYNSLSISLLQFQSNLLNDMMLLWSTIFFFGILVCLYSRISTMYKHVNTFPYTLHRFSPYKRALYIFIPREIINNLSLIPVRRNTIITMPQVTELPYTIEGFRYKLAISLYLLL